MVRTQLKKQLIVNHKTLKIYPSYSKGGLMVSPLLDPSEFTLPLSVRNCSPYPKDTDPRW